MQQTAVDIGVIPSRLAHPLATADSVGSLDVLPGSLTCRVPHRESCGRWRGLPLAAEHLDDLALPHAQLDLSVVGCSHVLSVAGLNPKLHPPVLDHPLLDPPKLGGSAQTGLRLILDVSMPTPKLAIVPGPANRTAVLNEFGSLYFITQPS
jgi:hypothetical protein